MTQLRSNQSFDCTSFEDRIHCLLDDRLTLAGDEILVNHASQCSDCARLLNDYETVNDSVKLLPEEIEKILSEAKEFDVTNGLGSFASRHVGLIASLAALILIAVGLFNVFDADRPVAAPPMASNSASMSKVRTVPFVASRPTPRRKTPDTSPFSPNFSVENSISMVSFPTMPSWDEVSKRLDQLEPVLNYSSEIPGIRPMQGSLNATLKLLKESFSKSDQESDPDLGFSSDARILAAA